MPRRGTFQKGHRKLGGRRKGSENLLTKNLKEAILEAARQESSDGRGAGELVGFFRGLAKKDIKTFASLLRALIPFPVTLETKRTQVYKTDADFRQALIDHGVPEGLFPPSRDDLHPLSPQAASTLVWEKEHDPNTGKVIRERAFAEIDPTRANRRHLLERTADDSDQSHRIYFNRFASAIGLSSTSQSPSPSPVRLGFHWRDLCRSRSRNATPVRRQRLTSRLS